MISRFKVAQSRASNSQPFAVVCSAGGDGVRKWLELPTHTSSGALIDAIDGLLLNFQLIIFRLARE
jgi:hypothetical protein